MRVKNFRVIQLKLSAPRVINYLLIQFLFYLIVPLTRTLWNSEISLFINPTLPTRRIPFYKRWNLARSFKEFQSEQGEIPRQKQIEGEY